jgi:hypothetical protein
MRRPIPFLYPKLLLNTIALCSILLLNTRISAQSPSLGGGLGLNALRSNGTYWITTNRPQGAKEVFGNPHISLNIDYNFPKKITHKWLSKIYNPVFSNPYLQLRGQLIFNQFRIHNQKDNSVGSSLLVYLLKFKAERTMNIFTEFGYKGGWNNTVKDPFHAVVMGIGSRHYLGSEWSWQTNLSYTYAFNDYIDKSGTKGLLKTVGDRYVLFNISLLKSFLTDYERRILDKSRDSLAYSKSFAANASQKAKLVAAEVKVLLEQFSGLDKKIIEHKTNALAISKIANEAIVKTNEALTKFKDSTTVRQLETAIDYLNIQIGDLFIRYRVDLEKATTDLIAKNMVEKKMENIEVTAKETRALLKSAYDFIPLNRDLERDVRRAKNNEVGTANRFVIISENDLKKSYIETEKSRTKIKEIMAAFGKAEKDLKEASDIIDMAKKVIESRK